MVGLVVKRAGGAVEPVGHLGAIRQAGPARQQLEIGAFEFERDDPACDPLGLGAVGHLFGQPPEMAVDQVGIGDIFGKGGLVRDRFDRSVARDTARILAPAEMVEPVTHRPEPVLQCAPVPPAQIGEGADARLFEARLSRRTDPPDHPHGFVGEEIGGFRRTDHRKPLRLVEVRGEFCQELVVGKPDGAGNAKLGRHAFDKPGQHHRRRGAVQLGGPGQVEEGLVEREGFDGGCQILHHRADLAGDLRVDLHPAFHDHRFRAEFQGLKHRHGGPHALDPCDIAGGGDHAAPPAADDDRLVAQVGIVALFDRGIEGIAIHMRDPEVEEFGMCGHAGAAAGGAPPCGLQGVKAIAAQGGHDGVSIAGGARRDRTAGRGAGKSHPGADEFFWIRRAGLSIEGP